MPLRKLASSTTHRLLAKLINTGAIAPSEPVTVSEKSEEYGLQVIVTISAFAPMRITPETLAKIEAMKSEMTGRAIPVKLTEQEKAIVAILNKATPRKTAWIWAKLGKAEPGKPIGGGFKTMLKTLERLGVLIHVERRGYMLA